MWPVKVKMILTNRRCVWKPIKITAEVSEDILSTGSRGEL
jgi:hypothetical protein